MNLVEEFDLLQTSGYSGGPDRLDAVLVDDEGEAVGPITNFDAPLLSVEPTIRQAARGRGQVVAVACANEELIVATTRGFVFRYFWDEFGNEKAVEVELAKAPDARVRNVFMDPGGNHVLLTLKLSQGLETHYLHRKWTKTRALPKLKGVALTAVGWQKQVAEFDDAGQAGGRGSAAASESIESLESRTGSVVVGTEGGTLHELGVDERAKKDHSWKPLFDFRDRAASICSLEQEVLMGGMRLVLVATPASVFIFTGGANLEALFASYGSGPVSPLLEADVPSMHSQLALLRPTGDPNAPPTRFAWLVGSAVVHGALQTGGNGGSVGVLPESRIALADGPLSPEDEPISMVMSEYHLLVLLPERLLAYNRISAKLVQDLPLKSAAARSAVSGAALCVLRDNASGSLYLASGDALAELVLQHEDRDMWKVYLEHQDFDNSLKLCTSAAQRDTVYHAQADALFAAGHYSEAAVQFAKIMGGSPPFEDIALRLVDAQDPPALQVFLSTKLSMLGPGDRAQATMVAAWLTELHLDNINRALLEAHGGGSAALAAHEAALRTLLQERVNVLDVSTTVQLLASYGRLEDLMHYASCRGDSEAVLEALMQRPGGASRALAVLRKPSVSQELVYKFAPQLITAAPEETVDSWIAAKPPLEPRRLLPALLRYGEASADPAKQRHVLRYIRFSMAQLNCQDSAVHNLALSLLSLDSDERPLLELLGASRDALGKPLYEPKHALRLVRERNRPRSCVKLLCELGMYEDAVRLALQTDLELAKSVANLPEDDDGLQRKLWLIAAQHVVTQQQQGPGAGQASSIKQAVEFLREAGGLLKIEDILPFFPDFVTIDNFKDAICDSLEKYNRQIEELKREMDEATDIADAVRRDLKLLQSRTASVSMTERCARCGRSASEPPGPPVGLPSGGAVPPLYVFPSGLMFHGACCAAEVMRLVGPQQAKKIKVLMQRLAKVKAGSEVVPALDAEHPQDTVTNLQGQLMEEVASECPWNGEVTLRMIDLPFIAADDKDALEASTWRI